MNKQIAELLPLAMGHKPSLKIIYKTLKRAYWIDRKQTIQMLLYIRDKNNWAWRRNFTRVSLVWLLKNDEQVFNKVIKDFIMVGRWDDTFFSEEIINQHVLLMIQGHLELDNTLLKKWLPKESSNPTLARVIAKWIWLTMKEYRMKTRKWTWPFVNTLFRSVESYNISII